MWTCLLRWFGCLVAALALAGVEARGGADDLAQLRATAGALHDQGKYAEAFELRRNVLTLAEQSETAASGQPGSQTSDALLELAYEALFAGRLQDAIGASRRGLTLKPDDLAHQSNLAHALLLSGSNAQAQAIYLSHKDQRLDPAKDELWQDVVEEDFDALTAAGHQHPSMPAILTALGIERRETSTERHALLEQARTLAAGQRFAEALPLAERYAQTTAQRYGPVREITAAALRQLGSAYLGLRRFDDAEAALKRAAAISEQIAPDGLPHLESLAALATLYVAAARYDDLDRTVARMVAIAGRVSDPQASYIAALVLRTSAERKKTRERFSEAKADLQRSLSLMEAAKGPDSVEVADTLDSLAGVDLHLAGFTAAEQMARRALAIREQKGSELEIAASLDTLANVLEALDVWQEVESLRNRAIGLREQKLGQDHPDVLDARAGRLAAAGQASEAEALYRKRLALAEKSFAPGDLRIAWALKGLAQFLIVRGRTGEAESLCERYLAIVENAAGPRSAAVSDPLAMLATLQTARGRNKEALVLLKRLMEVSEAEYGPDHPKVAEAAFLLATAYNQLDDKIEGERLARRALDITERVSGPDSLAAANMLTLLGAFLNANDRYAEAAKLLERAVELQRKAPGLAVRGLEGSALDSLATAYQALGRTGDIERIRLSVLSLWEGVLGRNNPILIAPLTSLADFYRSQGRLDEAEPLIGRALDIADETKEVARPTDLAVALSSRAELRRAQHRYDDAEADLRASIAIYDRVYGPGYAAGDTNKLAELLYGQQRWSEAADAWRISTRTIRSGLERGRAQAAANGALRIEIAGSARHQFSNLVKALYRSPDTVASPADARASEALIAAETSQKSDTAASLAQMAARAASQSPRLTALARERQDLSGEWSALDGMRISAASLPAARRNLNGERETGLRMEAIKTRLGDIDTIFATEFPDYAAIVNSQEVSAPEITASLRDGEALIVFHDTSALPPTQGETFIWVVTRSAVRWVRSSLGTEALQERVAALRCGLDRNGNWRRTADKQRWSARTPSCEAYYPEGLAADDPLPFDPAIAHHLYEELFGQIEDLIADKHLLLVPSGALTSLPFQVLVTRKPEPDQDERSLAWLARDHALTVLPSAASLIALRRHAGQSAAAEPFIGFGDPVLAGQCGPASIPSACPGEETTLATAAAHTERSVDGVGPADGYMRDGLADVTALRRACPLPDTRHELSCVAKSLGAPPSSLVLGKDMTEAAVKSMPLDRYRIVHFATHGLLAGESASFAKARAEPALLFTPPQVATDQDDGLLTASEIAALKLDSDWVILSACNTAAGDKPGAEALSGLARAFFYAGARALLVSHWPVNSYAATVLTSSTFAGLRKDPSMGRAEAVRRAMMALIDDPARPWAAHPSVWAPFIVVGEGGAPLK